MPRPDKVQAVAEIKERLEGARAVFLTEYRGIAVKQMGDLRRRLRAAGADYKVVKMTLAQRAAGDLGIEGLEDYLVGPTALAFANDDPVSVAKALSDFSKEDANLVIKLGLLADKILQPEEVSKLADIEPREVLLAKVAGAAKAPLMAMAGMLSSFTRDAAGLFSALLDKKDAEGDEVTEVGGAGAGTAAESPSPESPDTADGPEPDDAGATGTADEPDPGATADTQDDTTAAASDQEPAAEAEEE